VPYACAVGETLLTEGPDGFLRPRVCHYPPAPFTSGPEFTELARQSGLILDPWQSKGVLDLGLGETASGWASFQNTVIVSRQNGKDADIEALVLGWLFITGEKLIGVSAHEYKTAMESFRRVIALIGNNPDLSRKVKKIINTNGEEGIELHAPATTITGYGPQRGMQVAGQRARWLARSKGAGRGFTFNKLVLNEAYALTALQVDAILPTMSATINPQVWLFSSPPLDAISGEVLFQARRAALAGAPGTMFLDWGLEGSLDALVGCASPDCSHVYGRAVGCILDDLEAIGRANPAYLHRIPAAAIRRERAAMDWKGFARERAGIWPPDLSEGFTVITKEQWDRLEDKRSGSAEWRPDGIGWPDPAMPVAELAKLKPPTEFVGQPVLSIDVSPRSAGPVRASIGLAQRRFDGKAHLEIVLNGPGSIWVIDVLEAFVAKNGPVVVVVDPGSPAGSLVPDLEKVKGVHVETMGARDVTAAFGMIYDAANGKTADARNVAHLGQSEIMMALGGAGTRNVGDGGKAWDKRNATADITPLVSITNALWGLAKGFAPPAPVTPWVVYA